MPSIIDREIAWDLPQEDGTRNIREIHIDDSGLEHTVDYCADADTDIIEKLNNRIIYFPEPVNTSAQRQALLDQLAELESN